MKEAGTPPRLAGLIKIVRFNVQFYLLSATSLIAAILLIASNRLPAWAELIVFSLAFLAAFWTMSSLFVSWYVYDYAGVTRWEWLPARLGFVPQRWANIHAGLDESTSALRRLLPGTEGVAVDIYDPGEMTEPSIARARRLHPASEASQHGTFEALPLSEKDCDAVFLLFAAHELRNAEHRSKLLRQAARALQQNGCVVLLEHLRDWKNFLAFGPGFFHFFSRQDWQTRIRDAGLIVHQDSSVTPFVRFFLLLRADS